MEMFHEGLCVTDCRRMSTQVMLTLMYQYDHEEPLKLTRSEDEFFANEYS